jgi:hypothetical protein
VHIFEPKTVGINEEFGEGGLRYVKATGKVRHGYVY